MSIACFPAQQKSTSRLSFQLRNVNISFFGCLLSSYGNHNCRTNGRSLTLIRNHLKTDSCLSSLFIVISPYNTNCKAAPKKLAVWFNFFISDQLSVNGSLQCLAPFAFILILYIVYSFRPSSTDANSLRKRDRSPVLAVVPLGLLLYGVVVK